MSVGVEDDYPNMISLAQADHLKYGRSLIIRTQKKKSFHMWVSPTRKFISEIDMFLSECTKNN